MTSLLANLSSTWVDFYVDGVLICSDSAAAYGCSYKLGGAKGVSYSMEAVAFDQSSNMAKHQIVIQSSGGGTGGGGKGRK